MFLGIFRSRESMEDAGSRYFDAVNATPPNVTCGFYLLGLTAPRTTLRQIGNTAAGGVLIAE
jgi:hypothetical protein